MAKVTSKLYSAELEGIISRLVEVEVDMHVGLSSFTIVGLGDKAVSEAKERVASALKNCGFKSPTRENRRVTVNLAPADMKKNGSQYDLAIALGYLVASKQIKATNLSKKIFLGELALDGNVRAVPGVLNACVMAKHKGFTEIYIPKHNVPEVQHFGGVHIYGIQTLSELTNHLEEKICITPSVHIPFVASSTSAGVEISEIKGQFAAKRMLMVAAAGGHHALLSGPPGSGKTMLAQALVSILPQLTFNEALEITQIHSAANVLSHHSFLSARPFRAPHHSSSLVALVGGGTNPKPGEISLSHNGVLFLDEVPEFHRDVLEALRQPLESGNVSVSRSKGSAVFPARFLLVAASNPCPCGYYRDEERECVCTPYEISKYEKKLSGPLMDRIDLHMWIGRITSQDLTKTCDMQESEETRRKVEIARNIQQGRFKNLHAGLRCNADMSSTLAQQYISIIPSARKVLDNLLDSARLSTRGYFKTLKIAQTIADLDEKDQVDSECILEALSYRPRRTERFE